MSAHDVREPWWVPVPYDLGKFPKRAAFTISPDGMHVSPGVEAALRNAAQRLKDAGWVVDEVPCPSMTLAAKINEQLWMTEMRAGADARVEQEGEADSQFINHQMKNRITPVDVNGMLEALQSCVGIVRERQEFMQKYPVLIYPVSGELPFSRQQDIGSEAAFESIMQTQLTQRALPVVGLLGLAISTGAVGIVPVGVQLIADRYREDILITAGADIERRGSPTTVAKI